MVYTPDPIKDKEYYKSMKPELLKESFRWMTPEFKTVDSGKNTIKIRGVALHGDTVSRNNRVYVDEELSKAARTFIGKPVTINHNMNEKVGTVDWAEYEDGALEYLATIKKQPYVNLLRTKSANIRGVSIEAMYLRNICPKCGEKFTSEEQFHAHMRDKHFIKTNSNTVVHGLNGQALSLVLSPEVPGVPDTTIELMETQGTNRLFEMIIKDKGGKKEEMTVEESGHTVFVVDDDSGKVDTTFQQHPACVIGEVYNPITKQCEEAQEVTAKLKQIFAGSTKEEQAQVFKEILQVADEIAKERDERHDDDVKTTAEIKEQLNLMQAVMTQLRSMVAAITQSTLKETASTKSLLEQAIIRIDNLEDKLKPQFRSHSHMAEPIKETKDVHFGTDPLKEKKLTKK